MGLRDIGASLPPGFRFYPSDEELVCHYLFKKIANEEVLKGTLVEIDLHICEPWQLPEVAKLNSNEWYFFSFRDRKYATGNRTNRATTTGYWKATGKDRSVHDPRTGAIVGMRKTLVFYRNRAPHGIKTGWIMHEFRLENPQMPPQEDWVLCRVFNKSKREYNNNLSPENVFEITKSGSTSSPADQTMPSCGTNYQTTTSFSQSPPHQNNPPSTLVNHSPTLNPNSLQFSPEINNVPPSEINSKFDQDNGYGMLFDMTTFEETNLEDGVFVPNLGQMRFSSDNSLVFP